MMEVIPRQCNKMIQRQCNIRFNVPAFLGNAEQNGQWRTPPFKHLLREWWRVAWAESNGYPAEVSSMRAEEARLFGSAADGSGNRSLVRIRLGSWDTGAKTTWEKTGTIFHPEVKGSMNVDTALYLGYGPVKKAGMLSHAPAIDVNEPVILKLAFPADEKELLERAISLIDRYGCVGGRSRNGWGSFELVDGKTAIEPNSLPLRDWRDCLDLEWAHAIGRDNQSALIWRTQNLACWQDVINALAKIKVELRTSFPFVKGKTAKPEDRHWLSYPVSNSHSVTTWRNARLPNTLRFKVRKDENGKYYGVIFHMPCKPPSDFRPDRGTLIRVWSSVHQFLDAEDDLQRGR